MAYGAARLQQDVLNQVRLEIDGGLGEPAPADSAPSVIAAAAADLGGKNPVIMTLLCDFGHGDGRAVAVDRTARCSLVQNSVAIRAASTGNQHGAGRIIRGPRHKYRPDAIDKLEFNHPIIGDIARAGRRSKPLGGSHCVGF